MTETRPVDPREPVQRVGAEPAQAPRARGPTERRSREREQERGSRSLFPYAVVVIVLLVAAFLIAVLLS